MPSWLAIDKNVICHRLDASHDPSNPHVGEPHLMQNGLNEVSFYSIIRFAHICFDSHASNFAS